MNSALRPGEIVQVLAAEDIIRSINGKGTLDGLPFMPEMLGFCGGRFRVSHRVVQATIDDEPQSLREFGKGDVVLLEQLRCTGKDHDGCQRGCMTFWKEAWLKEVEEDSTAEKSKPDDIEKLRQKLKTKNGAGLYFCQSTQYPKATQALTRWKRPGKCVKSITIGNCSAGEMMKRLLTWAYWKSRQKLMGPYPRGNQKPTPVEALDLQAGELVEVKSLNEIVKTLDKKGKNRGLHFSPDMLPFCGRRYRVRSRADRLIDEISGKMRKLAHTVILEDVICDSAYYAFGGCPRSDFQYWREIWLRRV
jgi:hypothetical protein